MAVSRDCDTGRGTNTNTTLQAGAITISSILSIRESYAPTLLARKTKKLQKETGNMSLRSALDTGRTPKELFLYSIVRPTKMLFRSPIVFLLSLYVGVIYGYLYLLFTTITSVFQQQYNFSQGAVGLTYLGLGVGSLIGLFLIGATSDRLLNYLAAKNGEKKPEYRLPPMVPGAIFVPISLFMYGWTAYYRTHWIVPIIGTSFLGTGMMITFVSYLPSNWGPYFAVNGLIDAWTCYLDVCEYVLGRCIHGLRGIRHGG